MLKVEKLRHGGIMANYACNAACRHCLYACSPARKGGYISKASMAKVCALLREGGCRSVHIGGGEPFLDFDGLIELIRSAVRAGLRVEYVETNAFWAKDDRLIEKRLGALRRAGADTLCISLDPFHAEYVPVERPLMLAQVCRSFGFGYFIWQERYLSTLSRLDAKKAHTRSELELALSSDYIIQTANGYGLTPGGRAINIEAEYSAMMPAEAVVDSWPCRSLLSSDHFHADLYGRFIPPGCTGLAIPLSEAVHGIPGGKYPVYEALVEKGSAGLLGYAEALGFVQEQSGYTSRCALCFHIRRWLCKNAPSPELDAEHYEESLKYY